MMERKSNIVLGANEPENDPEVRRGPGGTAMQTEPPEQNERRDAVTSQSEERMELLPAGEAHELQSRWDKIQASFVDEPRKAVQEADALVDQTIRRLSETFTEARTRMEQDWGGGDNVSTENFRMTLRRYRSFFNRLLSV